MDEYLQKPSSSELDTDFDIADLGEPTPETMMAFFTELETAKQLAEHRTIKLSPGSDPDNPLPTGELQRSILAPPSGSDYSGPRLYAAFLDGSPDIIEQVGDQFEPIIEVTYSGPDYEIKYTYDRHGNEPTLYVKDKKQASVDSEAKALLDSISEDPTDPLDNLGDDLVREDNEERAAHEHGATKPTEGGMKKLVEGMRSALQAQQDYLAQHPNTSPVDEHQDIAAE